MLLDSTLRIFVSVADQLGVVDHKQVKHSTPPSAKLRTGCEILFRSADNPDSLRGPNLSGCWLDEGSLMSIDAFHVMLGRLREGGELGWLSVTTTPRGKSNWVYDVFASGRADTELIKSKTSANPFLAAGFADTVRRQYTSHLALQELEGEFVDAENSLFKRSWFSTAIAIPPIVSRVRAWDLAATPKTERKASDPDYTVGALLGKDEEGTIYILDLKRLRATPETIERTIRHTAEMDGKGVVIWMEEEGGSSGKVVTDHYARRVLSGFNFHSERPTGDKATRALPFAAACERGIVKLALGAWHKDFLDEAELFPFGSHDDQIDAVALAFTKLTSKQTFWMRVGGVTYDFSTGETVNNNQGGVQVITPEEWDKWLAEIPEKEQDPDWDPLYGRSMSFTLKDL
jgi:predicted phage terminase large subunit-like protein